MEPDRAAAGPWTRSHRFDFRNHYCRPPGHLRAARRLVFGAILAAVAAAALEAAAQPPRAAPAAGPEACARGREAYRRGEHEVARTALLECLAVEGDRLDLLLPLTVIALEAGDQAQALRFADRALAAAPEDPEALYWNGRALLAGGEPPRARERWEQALQRDGTHYGVLEGLARLAVGDGEPTRAYQFLMQMKQGGLDQPWLHRLLADIAAGRGLWSQALGHVQDALVLEPQAVADWRSSAELAILGGRLDKAVEYARHAVSLEPDGASLGGLGEAFFAADQVDSALVYLRKAVSRGGGAPRVRFNLANAMEVAGLHEEAGQQFRLFLKEQPNDSVGHFNYAIHLQKQGQLAGALAAVDQALRLDPGMLTAHVVRVQVLEDLGRWDDALGAVARLKELDRDNLAELNAWEQRLVRSRGAAEGAEAAGKMHLLHMVLTDREQLALVTEALGRGEDFAALVVQHSRGPAAARGGDIGWIKVDEMVEPIRGALLALRTGETSPPIESKGLIHLFKRIP
ncbi:tetratricopeptide repeat protein [bacterium]|nr:tetratricopeptide repeat protein [bacterium]